MSSPSQPSEEHQVGVTSAQERNPDNITVPEAVRIAELVRQLGFAGATFSPKGQGTIVVYHTDALQMTPQDFENGTLALLEELVQDYPRLNFSVQRFVIYMPRL